jgi:hypothetical protein
MRTLSLQSVARVRALAKVCSDVMLLQLDTLMRLALYQDGVVPFVLSLVQHAVARGGCNNSQAILYPGIMSRI